MVALPNTFAKDDNEMSYSFFFELLNGFVKISNNQ